MSKPGFYIMVDGAKHWHSRPLKTRQAAERIIALVAKTGPAEYRAKVPRATILQVV